MDNYLFKAPNYISDLTLISKMPHNTKASILYISQSFDKMSARKYYWLDGRFKLQLVWRQFKKGSQGAAAPKLRYNLKAKAKQRRYCQREIL